MKWRNISFKYKDIAEKCREGFAKAGIEVGDIFPNNEYWILPWMPMSKAEYEMGINIMSKYAF